MQTFLHLELNFQEERIYAEALRLLIAKLETPATQSDPIAAAKLETAKRMLMAQESGMYITPDGTIHVRPK